MSYHLNLPSYFEGDLSALRLADRKMVIGLLIFTKEARRVVATPNSPNIKLGAWSYILRCGSTKCP